MSEEFQKTIFEAFTREKTSTVSGIRDRAGYGDHEEYRGYDGRYHYREFREGKGSEFIVRLPCRISTGPRED